MAGEEVTAAYRRYRRRRRWLAVYWTFRYPRTAWRWFVRPGYVRQPGVERLGRWIIT